MADKLLPCPFCGNEARLVKLNFSKSYLIQCSRCFAEMGQYKTEEEAVASWNRRIDQNIRDNWHIGNLTYNDVGIFVVRLIDGLDYKHSLVSNDGEHIMELFVDNYYGSTEYAPYQIVAYQKIDEGEVNG